MEVAALVGKRLQWDVDVVKIIASNSGTCSTFISISKLKTPAFQAGRFHPGCLQGIGVIGVGQSLESCLSYASPPHPGTFPVLLAMGVR